jgi:hypothetical protein
MYDGPTKVVYSDTTFAVAEMTKRKQEREQVHVRMSPELYRAIVARAKKEERSITAVIERALREVFLAEVSHAAR